MKKILHSQFSILKLLPYLLLVIAILFNLYTLYPELSIKSDLNDNIFQFGLINRMEQVWENKILNSPFSILNYLSLLDHWVPNWAVGYPLPFYYSHLPHLVLVASFRLTKAIFNFQFSIFNYFHFIQYLLLALIPLSFYLGARKFGFSKLTAGLIALFSSHLSTDGLYGIDPSSFTWRGFGLSLQALSVFFLPLALGFIWQSIKENRKYLAAILVLAACLASHIATGYIGLLSCLLIPLALAKTPILNSKFLILNSLKRYLRLLVILAVVFFLLSYWFIPLVLNNQYHAVSFWDSPSKWFSYGFKEVINLFLNGDLLDFGRLPVLTMLTIVGFLVAAFQAQKPKYRFFFLLFPFWLILFFGQPTLGGLIKLLPLAGEYHLHRLLIGVHLASIFLIGIGASWLLERVMKLKLNYFPSVNLILSIILIILIALPVFRQTNNYLDWNKKWLSEANQKFDQDWTSFEKIIQELNRNPQGRIYAGRAGNWGRNLQVGPTPLYMALSVRGFETSGFLPETWSLNSDPEQFFNEQWPEHYNLYNIRYLVTPPDYQIPDFAQEVATFGNYKLSQVETSGYFDLGYSDLAVLTKKENILNIIHAWLASNFSRQKQFPALVLNGEADFTNQLEMIDEANFKVLGKEFNLFANPPFDPNQPFKINPPGKVLEENLSFQKYEAEIEVDEDCQSCLAIFKMTYHPNWQAKIDNQPAEKFMVFPSFIAVKISSGVHRVSFEYQPSSIKLPLLVFGGIILLALKFFEKRLRQLLS